MKTGIFLAVIAGLALSMTGCVNTVDNRSRAGVPFVKDQMAARYERPMAEVFEAAKRAVAAYGTLSNESTLLNNSNSVRVVEGRVNQRTVWVRVEAIEPKLTEVTVQARTQWGGTDLQVVHELEKRVALELVR